MPVNVNDVLQLLATLADERNLRVSVKESVKGGLIAGTSTLVGGLVGGPIGLAVGGTVGGCVAAYCSWGKFKPVSAILWEMNEQEKQKLYDQVQKIIRNLSYTDLFALQAMVGSDMGIKAMLLDTVIDHVKNSLHMDIVD